MEMPAILKAGSNIVFRISENHDGVISQFLCPFEGIKLQLFPVAFALGIRMNAQRTECQYILFVPVGINQLTPGVHDIADDFPVFFQNKVKFRYKIGVLPQSMRQIVFTAARNVDVPKRSLCQLLHCAEVPLFFISNPHIARPPRKNQKCLAGCYISCLPSRARDRVTSSAYSSWLPTGTP